MRRRLPIWFVIAFLVGMGVVWLFPASRYRLIGLLRNESSFLGRPASYWANALKKGPTGDIKLLRHGGAAAVPVLAELAQYEEDEVRVEALLALAVMGPEAKGAAPVLLELLSSERSPPVLDLAKQILLQVDRQAAMLGCLELLKKSTTIHSRSCALDGLDRIGPEDAVAVEPLTKALDDENLLVRAVAAKALWRINRRAEPILPALIDCLGSQDKEVSVYAGETLSQDIRTIASAALSDISQRDLDPSARQAAAKALAQIEAQSKTRPTR